jgi:RNA polymerase sigma-70 factor (ECF subfamily)
MDDDIRQHLDARRYREALDLLVDRYQDKVFHLALSLIRDRGVAEDVAQEVFIRIWKGLPGYHGAASLSTWIYTIARNTCLSELRRLASRPRVFLEESGLDSMAARPEAEPEALAGMDVHAMLRHLPERYRQAMILYYLEEKSYQEVAEMLGIPMGTVKTFLHRGKKELVEISERREGAPARPSRGVNAYGLS